MWLNDVILKWILCFCSELKLDVYLILKITRRVQRTRSTKSSKGTHAAPTQTHNVGRRTAKLALGESPNPPHILPPHSPPHLPKKNRLA
ncbi:hypothetical protein J5N97_010170 [Dioscorea zingiberensis]|uniref:Uncharacterized protein n=1 Tax=Dioscorea zingiberensis TaxID=325984 RepID=A0A9D5HM75_9LILI|nr:hypothetical protein J5N97_010170 [Dioscorea zingiberensis]